MKQQGVSLLPPGWNASLSQGYPPAFHQASLPVPNYTSWVERGMGRVKCLAKEHNTLTQPGLDPRPLDQEHNALTIKPLGLPTGTCASSLTLYTLTSVHIFSILFFIHFLRYQHGEFF